MDKKVIKRYDCLQPFPLEPEEYGNVDSRIYSIRKCGVSGEILYKWPHQYEAQLQKKRADALERKLQERDEEARITALIEELKKVKSTLADSRRENNALNEQIKKLISDPTGAETYIKILQLQKINSECGDYHNKLQSLEAQCRKHKEANDELVVMVEKQQKEIVQRGKEIERLEDENEELRKQINGEKKRKINQLQTRLESVSGNNLNLKAEIRDLERQIRDYKDRLGEV